MAKLSIFPVSMKVAGRRIVIVGGGVEALNKARLAVKTSADVVVVASEFTADFDELPVRLINRRFAASDLDGAALVFVADEGDDSVVGISAARVAGVPLNVVDKPELCDFYTPAIVDRAPISVAISSEGDAPVLSRMIRAQIEALLTPETGMLARLAGELRERATKLLPDGAERRRFYEALVSSPDVIAALVKDVPSGRRAALRLLNRHSGSEELAGAVWVIGAGPGDADLLTLKAQRVLQQADVIVHDRRLPDSLVQMGRRDARRELLDEFLNDAHGVSGLLADFAAKGEHVAWLVSGDATGSELVEHVVSALHEAEVTCGVVPGVPGAAFDTASAQKVA